MVTGTYFNEGYSIKAVLQIKMSGLNLAHSQLPNIIDVHIRLPLTMVLLRSNDHPLSDSLVS